MNREALKKYDAIRPFEPEELPEVFARLLADAQFRQVLAYLYPGVPLEAVAAKMNQCRTNLDFQKAFCYGFIKDLLAKASCGCAARRIVSRSGSLRRWKTILCRNHGIPGRWSCL